MPFKSTLFIVCIESRIQRETMSQSAVPRRWWYLRIGESVPDHLTCSGLLTFAGDSTSTTSLYTFPDAAELLLLRGRGSGGARPAQPNVHAVTSCGVVLNRTLVTIMTQGG